MNVVGHYLNYLTLYEKIFLMHAIMNIVSLYLNYLTLYEKIFRGLTQECGKEKLLVSFKPL